MQFLMIQEKYVFNRVILNNFSLAVLTRTASMLHLYCVCICQTTADEENKAHFSL